MWRFRHVEVSAPARGPRAEYRCRKTLAETPGLGAGVGLGVGASVGGSMGAGMSMGMHKEEVPKRSRHQDCIRRAIPVVRNMFKALYACSKN